MIRRLWNVLVTPSSVIATGTLLIIGFFAGVLFWGSFNWAVVASNDQRFCISCHVMRDNAYAEFVGTPHHMTPSGVGATCADCHVPRQWLPKMVRKAQGARELYHYIIGTIDTPEKYEAHRAVMAQRVWDQMTANDSAECRSCHLEERFDYSRMSVAAATIMKEGLARGETCIDCHKGIAHELPAGAFPDQEISLKDE